MRQPAVADRFYPGSSQQLAKEVAALFADAGQPDNLPAFGIICPHAGYIYSGNLAAKTINNVHIPETVLILGPNHHGRGADVALSVNPWQMPFGVVEIDTQIGDLILAEDSSIRIDEAAHTFEHSLEVQIPLLHYRQPDLKIVPLVISHLTIDRCLELGDALGRAVKKSGKQVLFLASSDMNHYESREHTKQKDQKALHAVAEMNPELLIKIVIANNISMCGVMPAAITIQAARHLGATQSKLIGYTDSGDVNGDTRQVVGYAGVAFF